MMDKSDGRNNAGRLRRVSSSDSDFENTAYSDSYGDSSVENSPFRGFEKEPKVLIEKFDIEPFLRKPRLKTKTNMGKSLNGIYNTLPQLVSNCYVKLAREDLKQLQKYVLENSRLNKLKTKGIVQSDTEVRQKSPPAKSRRMFNMNGNLPNLMQPRIVLERIDYIKHRNSLDFIDSSNLNIDSGENGDQRKEVTNIDATLDKEVDSIVQKGLVDPNQENVVASGLAVTDDLTTKNEVRVVVKKAIVDPKSKKTIISRFQCQKCLKYYSNNYCLNRHMLSVHQVNLQCHVCEEIFVWPSLLKSHKCIRMNIPEMPFDDARPEIQFDNYRDFGQAGIGDLINISESEDYMNAVDFEIPAPIVELTEYENPDTQCINQNSNYGIPVHNSYKIIMQEVPIEF